LEAGVVLSRAPKEQHDIFWTRMAKSVKMDRVWDLEEPKI